MKRTILPMLAISLIVMMLVITCIPAGAAINIKSLRVSIKTTGTGYIAGTITNPAGNPVENAHITAFTLGILPWMSNATIASASSSTNGYYEMTVPEGEYNVLAFKFGAGVAFATPVLVEEGKTTNLDLSLTGGFNPVVVSVPQNTPLNLA